VRATLADLSAKKAVDHNSGPLEDGGSPLTDLARGEGGVVRALTGGVSFLSRMASLGFTPGAPVHMVQNYGRGALIVNIRGTRIALGRGEARRVRVVRRPHDELPHAISGDGRSEG
jgi:ferrous iron transport protein A